MTTATHLPRASSPHSARNRQNLSLLSRLAERYDDCQAIAERWLNRRPAPSIGLHDLTHEVVMKLARQEDRRRRAHRSELAAKPTAVLFGYVNRVCKDVLYERWRKRLRRREQPLSEWQAGAAPSKDTTTVEDALKELAARDSKSAQSAELLQLRSEGFSIEECARRLGIPRRTADRRLQHGREFLDARLRA